MKVSTVNSILISFVLAATLAGALAYPHLPDEIASHWNAAGEADGTMSKFWGIFLLPMVMAGIFLLYLVILKIDPLQKNIQSFRKYYDFFFISLFVFLGYIFTLQLFWNFDYRFNFMVFIIPAFALLWHVIGVVLEKSKRNWFMGIRTPWTLSSDVIWEKTHVFGGKLFKVASLITLSALFFSNEVVIVALIVVPVALIAAITAIYSYIEYRKQG